ncbi:MAG: RsmD family RNA methyltransferase, partial [Pseudomonadota bacterium]|nr:RsmD family RNA methyltransferase [Pseudomonadota bacterium]
ALGLEAASRGADEVVLVDSDPDVTRTLQEQVQLLDAGQVRVVHAEGSLYLRGQGQAFDVVFLDPPYADDLLPACIRQLEAGGWLGDDAWIYIEAERNRELVLPDNWQIYRSKSAGQVGYHLARRAALPG